MVDFEGGNAERPFVLGAHYNGEAKSGYHNTDNRVKAIHTKSGHKLVFTEDESILLSDKNGNTLRFDTQGKNIEISAPETISIRCKNFELNASQNIKTEAGQDHIETITKDKRTTISQNFSVEVTGDMIEHISGSIDSHTDQERKISSNDMGIESKHNMRAKASGKTQRFSGERTMDN